MKGHIRRVCVFGGSRPGNDPMFLELAYKTGRQLADSGYEFMNGGVCNEHSVMTYSINGALDGGIEPSAVDVHFFEAGQGVPPAGVHRLTSKDMFERKGFMVSESDAFIVLPGGVGTIDEIGEVMVDNDIKKHIDKLACVKPVLMVNPVMDDGIGFWDLQMQQYQRTIKYGFANANIGRFIADIRGEPDGLITRAIDLLDKLNEQGPILASAQNTQLILNAIEMDEHNKLKAELEAQRSGASMPIAALA